MNSLPSPHRFIHSFTLAALPHGLGDLTGNRKAFLFLRRSWLDGRRWQTESFQELAEWGGRRAENTIWEGSKHFPEKVKSQMRSDGVIEMRWVKAAPTWGVVLQWLWVIPGRGNTNAKVWRLSEENVHFTCRERQRESPCKSDSERTRSGNVCEEPGGCLQRKRGPE